MGRRLGPADVDQEPARTTGLRGVELRTTHKHGVEPSLDESAAQGRRQAVRRQRASSWSAWARACEYHSPDPAVVKKNIDETKAFIRLATTCGGSGREGPPQRLAAGRAGRTRRSSRSAGRSTKCAAFGEGYGVEIRLEIHGRGTSRIAEHQEDHGRRRAPERRSSAGTATRRPGRRRPGSQFRTGRQDASAPSTSTT